MRFSFAEDWRMISKLSLVAFALTIICISAKPSNPEAPFRQVSFNFRENDKLKVERFALSHSRISDILSDWIRRKVPAEFDLSLIDLDTILS